MQNSFFYTQFLVLNKEFLVFNTKFTGTGRKPVRDPHNSSFLTQSSSFLIQNFSFSIHLWETRCKSAVFRASASWPFPGLSWRSLCKINQSHSPKTAIKIVQFISRKAVENQSKNRTTFAVSKKRRLRLDVCIKIIIFNTTFINCNTKVINFNTKSHEFEWKSLPQSASALACHQKQDRLGGSCS